MPPKNINKIQHEVTKIKLLSANFFSTTWYKVLWTGCEASSCRQGLSCLCKQQEKHVYTTAIKTDIKTTLTDRLSGFQCKKWKNSRVQLAFDLKPKFSLITGLSGFKKCERSKIDKQSLYHKFPGKQFSVCLHIMMTVNLISKCYRIS